MNQVDFHQRICGASNAISTATLRVCRKMAVTACKQQRAIENLRGPANRRPNYVG